MTTPRRTRLAERRDRALDDLLELERQVASGEIGREDAARLQARYEAEAADAITTLERREAEEPESGRSPRRVAVGVAVFVAVAAVAAVALVNAVEPRPEGGFVTGGLASDAAGGAPDLASISNEEMEEVVAQYPDVIPMRLALARRYVEEGDFSAALDHYFYILEREQNAEALMYVGWMTHVSGDSVTGAALLEHSLQVAPDEPLAQWFLAVVLFDGLGDRVAAIPLLEGVIASGVAPPEVVEAAQEMLSEARS